MLILTADPNNVIFIHNLKVCRGVFHSPSFIREVDENLKGVVSLYEVVHTDQVKEDVFEKIRAEYYPDRPSRMGAIFLFQDLETAIKANNLWWGNTRYLYETKIKDGAIVMIADSQWLNCTESEYKINAHKYFQEEKTDDPIIEMVIMGVVEVSLEPVKA